MAGHGGGLKCQHCTADTVGVVLCKRCRTTLSVSLQNVGSYHADLFSLGAPTRVRSRRVGEQSDPTGTAAGASKLGPVEERLAAEATNALTTWVRLLLDDRAELMTKHPTDTVADMVKFLRASLGSIATLEWAGELVREILALERRLLRTISRGKGYWHAGICAAKTGLEVDDWCPEDLFIQPGQSFVRCRACGHSWSVEQRRRFIIEESRETLLPVALIARVAVTLLDGEPSVQRLEARLRQWVHRGQLEDYGVRVLVEGQQPKRVYRLGEVIDKLAADAAHRQSSASGAIPA